MHKIIITEDGSVTLYIPELNEHYHSIHGAIQESQHIFIAAGLEYFLNTCPPETISIANPLHILEAGFGTGLNAWLTLIRSSELQIPICYHTIEKYPLANAELEALNYTDYKSLGDNHLFHQLHECSWETEHIFTPYFKFCKHKEDFQNIDFPPQFDIIYFDAFNPDVQPHLWSTEVFERFYNAMKPNGILTTYCVKGIVKQALRATGFTIKRLPGPPGKRQILRATKTSSI